MQRVFVLFYKSNTHTQQCHAFQAVSDASPPHFNVGNCPHSIQLINSVFSQSLRSSNKAVGSGAVGAAFRAYFFSL